MRPDEEPDAEVNHGGAGEEDGGEGERSRLTIV